MNSMLQERLLAARQVGRTVSDDGDVALVVEYIGSQPSGTVTVSAGGDITFKHGAVGSEAVDPTIDSGGDDDGVIDVSDSNANTFGKVVDLINGSANWRAYLVDVLRSDNSNASTGSILAASETQAKVAGGYRLFKDTSKVLNLSVALRNGKYPDPFTKGAEVSGVVTFPVTEAGKWSEAMKIVSNNTFDSGSSTIEVHRVNRFTGASVKMHSRAGGATTVEQTIDLSDGAGRGLATEVDEYLLVRMVGSAACTGFLTATGKVI